MSLVWLTRGQFYMQFFCWAEAAADFSKALDLLPTAPEYGYLESSICSQLQQWDQALDKAIALRPADGRMYAIRGRDSRDEWDNARADYGQALKLRPNDGDLRLERGALFAKVQRWKEAAADYDRAAADRHFDDDWRTDACLRILSGDDDGYRKLCAHWPSATARRKIRRTPSGPGTSCRWRPTPASMRRWRCGGRNGPSPPRPRRGGASGAERQLHALGLAHYRAGQFEAAVRWYHESMKVASPAMPPAEPLNWLGLALAYHRLKQPDEARRCLDKATALMKQANADRPKEEVESPPLTMTLSDWLEYQILRREAETLLKEPAPKLEK